MNPLARAQVPLGSSGRDEIERARDAALAIGGTFCNSHRESERLCTTQDLLCAAGNAVVDQVMLAQVFHAQSLLDDDFVSAEAHDQARALRDASAGVVRMTARALEVHARDTGYCQAAWLTDSLDETERLMTDDRDPLFDPMTPTVIAMARSVARELFSALAAAPADRMGVPGHVARALGASVALFMVADFTYNDDYRLRIS
ncbi:MAG: hypothetical protein ACPHCI_03990 [Solirubrobacterales bacterium]